MCINIYENYSEEEKIDLLKQYVDHVVNSDETANYDLFRDIDNNNTLKRKFLRAVVPCAFDCLDYSKLVKNDNNILHWLQKYVNNVWYEFPTYVMMSFVCGAIYCYNDDFISLKKLLWRWSKILLNC